MHPYSANSKRGITVGLTLMSTGLAWLVSRGLSHLEVTWPWFLEGPSILAILGLLWLVFDKVGWKTRLAQRHLRGVAPDLSGDWELLLRSSFDGFKQEHKGTVTIRQTWTRLCVTTKMAGSRSDSTAAAFVSPENATRVQFAWLYSNTPNADAVNTMQIHHGTATMDLDELLEVGDGQYYTGRGRQNYGRLVLTRSAKRRS